MRIRDTLRSAREALSAQKSRSLLTMLGIIIGVGSVVLMTSIGASMEKLILGQISSLGSSSMVIFPGGGPQGQNRIRAGFDSLTFRDIEALKKLRSIESVAPIVFAERVVTYDREETFPPITGTTPHFFLNQSISVDTGRLLSHEDIENAAHVVVLGIDTARELFPVSDPIGKRIRIDDRAFTVIGVLRPIGSQFFQNFDERIFIPISVSKSMTGKRYVDYVTMRAVGSFDLAFSDVKWLLRKRHGIVNPDDDPDKDDFVVRSSEQANDILSSVSLGLTLFITAIAGISLVVGGIGIMNIMLVAVSERTREIGLRKALGARRRDVLFQFLVEAIVLTLIGGLIGLFGGTACALLIAAIMKKFLESYVFAFSVQASLVALFIAAITGLIFGMYPARKAASLHPIESLRYE